MSAYELNLVGLAEERVEEMLRLDAGPLPARDDQANRLWHDPGQAAMFRNAGGRWERMVEMRPGEGEFSDPLLWALTEDLRTDGTVPDWANQRADSVLTLGDRVPQKIPAVVIGLVSQEYDAGQAPEAGTYQRANAVLGVWHVVKCRNTRRGDRRRLDEVAQLSGATRYALQAWLPAGVRRAQADPLRLRRGVLERIENGRAVWLDEYAFSWRPAGRSIR